MKGFVADIQDLSRENTDFRRVLYAGRRLQLVLMSLRPGEEVGEEVHGDLDQFIRIESGDGEVVIDGATTPIRADHAILVPAGARHNVINTGCAALNLYTFHGPPGRSDAAVRRAAPDAPSPVQPRDGKAAG